MYDPIRRIAAWLRSLVLGPCAGRHRAGAAPAGPTGVPAHRRRLAIHLPVARSPYGLDLVLDGGASALVRPYLLAADQEHARRRRLALGLAADFGLDLDPHVIGAQGVAV